MKLILIGDVFAVTFFEVFCDCLLLMENAFLECWHSHKTSPAFSKADDVICPKLYFPAEMYSFNAAT